jgi:hypothetical protein
MGRDVTKEIDGKFFDKLIDLLDEYIEPKDKIQGEFSEKLSYEIYFNVKDICSSNGYWWETIKHECVGTYILENDTNNLPTR